MSSSVLGKFPRFCVEEFPEIDAVTLTFRLVLRETEVFREHQELFVFPDNFDHALRFKIIGGDDGSGGQSAAHASPVFLKQGKS
jgi:hypothetical protein